MDALKNFGSPWLHPWLLFPKLLMGFCCNRSYMKVRTKLQVRSFTRSWDNRGYLKTLDSPWIHPRSLFCKIFNGLLFELTLWIYWPNLKSVASSVPEIITIEFLGGSCEPQIMGKRRPWGSGMVPFERALVSAYRPSIVTFPLSLRVSEILPLLCSSTPLFPPNLPKISHVPLGLGAWPLGYEQWRCWANCLCN